MTDCKPAATPADPSVQLRKPTGPQDPSLLSADEATVYRELVGSLLYLVACTRADIAAAVHTLSRYMATPTKPHMIAAKHVLRYLKGTANMALVYKGSAVSDLRQVLRGYADANYGGDLDTRRSTTGYLFLLNGASVSWESRLQQTVALSSMESEYMSLASAAQQAIHLRLKLSEMGYPQQTKTVIFEDNQPAIHVATNPVTSVKSKHIDIKYHFIREKVEAGVVAVEYVASEDNPADCLTKPLEKIKFSKFRDILLGRQLRSTPGI
jgi:hypothetical protein